MKKIIISLLCMGLLTNSMSAISMVRAFQCRPSSPSKSCSRQELQDAQKWFKNSSTAALGAMVAALAALGLIVGVAALQREKNRAQQPATEPNVPETQAQKNERELGDIQSKIITLKLDLQNEEKKLKEGNLTTDEQARMRQIMKNYETEIDTLQKAQDLIIARDAFKRTR